MIGALLVERILRLPHFISVLRQVNQLAKSIVNRSEARVGVVDHAARGDVELADTLNHRCRVPYAPLADSELRVRSRDRVSAHIVHALLRLVLCAAPNTIQYNTIQNILVTQNGRVPSESNGRHHTAH